MTEPKIRQIVVEVHDIDDRLARIVSLLKHHGYDLVVQQEALLQDTILYDVYAVRPAPGQARRVDAPPYVVRPAWSSPARLVGDVRHLAQEQLPDAMVPSGFVLLEALPLTPNGKLDRRALPDPQPATTEADRAFAAPHTAAEQALAAIWSQVLGIKRAGRDDSFFALGGHSLLATQLVARVRAAFEVDLSLRSIFEHPTLAGLAGQIEAATRAARVALAPPIPPSARDQVPPLSLAQQGIWFVEQLAPGNPSYTIALAVRLTGVLDLDALQKSLEALVERHEALRTTFPVVEGRAVQAITAGGWGGDAGALREAPLRVTDLGMLSGPEQEAEARRLAQEEARRPFDLARGPLLRAGVLRLGETAHVLLLSMHHIISDGWSLRVLARELAAFYAAFRSDQPAPRSALSAPPKGQSAPLSALPIQYADYAVWQRAWLLGENEDGTSPLQRLLAYWKQQLAGLPPLLQLPTDRPRPPVQGFSGATTTFMLTPQLSAGLRDLVRREGVTMYMALLAAFKVLLARYSGQYDIVVASSTANRTRAEIEGLIGLFLNMLLLRTDLSGNPTFRELLGRVRAVTLGAYAHQDLPFEQLVEALQPERNLSYNPLFQVSFVFLNLPTLEVDLPGLEVELLETDRAGSQIDLTLAMMDTDAGLRGWLEYSTDLFDGSTIERMIGHFETLLGAIVVDPALPVSELPILTEAERRQLLVEWNATEAELSNACVHHLFEAQAARTPDSIALLFDHREPEQGTKNKEQRIDTPRNTQHATRNSFLNSQFSQVSYAELNARANRLAHHLRALGVGPETHVGLCLERSIDLVVALLAILKAGGAFVPLDPTYPAERLTFMLEDSLAPLLITQERLRDELPTSWAYLLAIDADRDVIAQEPATNLEGGAQADNLAYVIYTSGSTGRPKGVQVTHRGLGNLAAAQIRAFDVRPHSRVLQFASISFDAAISEILMALLSGAALCLATADELRPGPELIGLLRDQVITTVTLPPSVLAALPAAELPALTTLVAAGEACPVELVVGWGASRRFLNAYGPTEASVCATIARCPDAQQAPPIGQPIDNVQVYLLDARMQPVPIGIPGELYIGGIGLARGYLNRPDLTAEWFIPNPFAENKEQRTKLVLSEVEGNKEPRTENRELFSPAVSGRWSVVGGRLYRTGDLARYRPDGNIEFLGRADDQVKLRGFRMELGEIEAALRGHPAVREAAVVVREDAPGDKRLVAYIITDQEQRTKPVLSEVEGNKEQTSEESHSQFSILNSQFSELRRHLNTRLPDYMIPAAFVTLEALPLTANGKVDRHALPAPDRDGPVAGRPFAMPRTPTEELLAGVWAAVLRRERISVEDNFFDLGGHSLLVTQVLARVREIFGVELPVSALFEATSVASLAERVERARREAQGLPASAPQPMPRNPDPSIRQDSAGRGDGALPLSVAQQRLWFLDQLEPGTAAYTIRAAVRLLGPLDIGALERGVHEIVRRHESLRTSFPAIDGQPAQIIAPVNAPHDGRAVHESPLQVIDLREVPTDRREAEALRLAADEAGRPFDLARGPLLRVTLLQLDQEAHALIVIVHHIVSDGWSIDVLIRELMALYQAFSRGQPSPLPELPIQYADFAQWQRAWLQGEPLEALLAYWKERLRGIAPLDLPAYRPRPPLQSATGAQQMLLLPGDLSDAIRALGRRMGATMFMVTLAAFQALLARYTGQDDIAVGAPISSRTHRQTEGLIGLFLNTLVLRTDLSGDPTFGELIERVRGVCLGAYAHQDMPFEQLVDLVQPVRDLSRTPLFQVMITQAAGTGTEVAPAGLRVEPLPLPDPVAKYDLTLYVGEQREGLRLVLVYNADLFEARQMADLLDHLQNLLRGAVADPGQHISTLPLEDEARARLNTRMAMPCPGVPFVTWDREAIDQAIHERFEQQAALYPANIAVKTRRQAWTYDQLNRTANQVARAILAAGAGDGTQVALLFDHDAPMIAAILGALKAGATYVPLDPAYPQERLAMILADSQARLVLTESAHQGFAQGLAGAALPSIVLEEIDPATPDTNLGRPVAPDAVAYILYTSGSTGQPKGVMQSHRNVLHHIRVYTNNLHISARDRLTLFSSYSFDAAVMDIFGALLNGATLCPLDARAEEPARLVERLAQAAISIYHSTPTVYRYVVGALGEAAQLPGIRLVVLGGEEVLARDLELYQRHFAHDCLFVNGLGPTESTVSLQYIADHQTKLTRAAVPVGYPVDDTTADLLTPLGEQVAAYGVGEIVIRSPHIALGYWQKPEATEAAFAPDPFAENKEQRTKNKELRTEDRGLKIEDSSVVAQEKLSSILNPLSSTRLYRTGDLGRRLPNGMIEFAGRKDFQVKLRGYRIELGEIEAALRRHGAVREAAVVAHQESSGEKRLVAYIVPDQEQRTKNKEQRSDESNSQFSILNSQFSEELRDYLKTRLPDYMIPATFVTLEALPLTPTGKVDRRALPAPAGVQGGAAAFVAPRTPIEELVAGSWAAVLGLERVGVHDNFFELGGHSLSATRLVFRLREACGVELPLRALFEAPTVAGLAATIGRLQGRRIEVIPAALPQIVPDPQRRHEPFPLTDIQQAYWVGRSGAFELGNVSTHSYREIETAGLDLERFTAACRRLIDRHDMLRAIIRPDGRQQILSQVQPFELVALDLRGQPAHLVEAELLGVREELSHQVLPSDQWPLFDIRASLLGGGRVRLHISTDALISDAWSRQILIGEFARLYADPDAVLEPLDLSFRDYVLAEAALRNPDVGRGETEHYARALAYWRGRMDTLPPAPELPLAQSPGALAQPRFVRRSGRLEPERWRRLQEAAARTGLTPSGALLAAFADILAAWSKSPRFTINLTLFNRLPLHPQVNAIMGDFTSITLLAVEPAASDSFTERARRLQEQLWDDLDHRYVGGVQVLRELARARGTPAAAAMPVVFTSTLGMRSPGRDAAPAQRADELTYSISQTPQVWLDHQAGEHAGALIFNWDAVEDLFPAGMLDDMFAAYCRYVERLADQPAAWTATERRFAPPAQLARRAATNATTAPLPDGHAAHTVQRPSAAAPRPPGRDQRRSHPFLRRAGPARGRGGALAPRPRRAAQHPGRRGDAQGLGAGRGGARHAPRRRGLLADRPRAADRALPAPAGPRRGAPGADAVGAGRAPALARRCRAAGGGRTGRRRERGRRPVDATPAAGRPGLRDLHLRLDRVAQGCYDRASGGPQHDPGPQPALRRHRQRSGLSPIRSELRPVGL